MGACASVSKQIKAEDGTAAPLPEAPKEEILGQVTEVKPKVIVAEDDKKPSLESLLSLSDEVKETETEKEVVKTEEEIPEAKEQEKKVEQVKEN